MTVLLGGDRCITQAGGRQSGIACMDLLDEFFAERPVSPGTRAQYTGILRLFLEQLQPETCTISDVLRFLDQQKWGDSRRYVAVVAIKQLIRWRVGDVHPVLRLRVRRGVSRPGRSLSSGQVIALLASFDTLTRKGTRDLAIACLALDTGLRVGELASLRSVDVDMSERRLVVQIKGGRWAEGVFSEQTAQALLAWLPFRKAGDERLFQVTRDGLKVIIRRWGHKVGFVLSAHDLRRTFATLALRSGAPSRLVQVAGRWADIRMVERYSRAIEPDDFRAYFPVSRAFDS